MDLVTNNSVYDKELLKPYKDFVKYVKEVLDTAYGGVNNWSEADAFEGIYERIKALSD